MTRIKDKDRRFKFLEVKVGAMAAAAIVGIVVVFALIGFQKDIFSAKYRIYFVSKSASGLKVGLPVKLSGFKIGRVKGLELIEGAKVKVTLVINRKYVQWLHEGSTVRLAKEGLIGDPFIEVTTGRSGDRTLTDGEMIPFMKAGGIEQLIDEAKPVLDEVKELIRYANSPDGGVRVVLGNIKALSGEMRETRRSLDKTVSETRSLIKKTDRLIDKMDEKGSRVLDKASNVLDNVEGLTLRLDPVMTRVEGIMDKADKAATRLPVTMEKIDTLIDEIGDFTGIFTAEAPRMRKMLLDAADAAHDGRDVIKGVKRSWPLRLMMPPVREPGLVPLDGYLMKGVDD